MEMCGSVLLVFVALVTRTCGYNVDTTQPIIRQTGVDGTEPTAFGAAVAIHRTESAESAERSMLVGAPKDGTEGVVYECSITNSSAGCWVPKGLSVPLDQLRNSLNSPRLVNASYNLTDMLFGQTVVSTKGRILACAPRGKLRGVLTRDKIAINSWYPTGFCAVPDASVYEPLYREVEETRSPGSSVMGEKYVLAEFGFSASIGDNLDVVVGCPLCYVNAGSGFITSYDTKLKTSKGSESVNTSHTDPQENKIAYRGFSVAVGTFFSTVMYALGEPKAYNFRGNVSIVESKDSKLQRVTYVSGNEVGAMFGYSIAALDLNGDNYSDLVVGAPFHGGSSKDDVNVGEVFVYLSNKTKKELLFIASLEGKGSDGMFGLTVISLGDIDLDGFQDFAVAAPFLLVGSSESESGVVYIFRGARDGLRSKDPSQVITPQPELKTFGYALAGRDDVDENKYSDVLVGAQQSQKVLLFRTHPIVVVSATLTANPEEVSLDDGSCQNKEVCFKISVCIGYDVKTGANSIPSLAVNYTLQLDSKKTEKRLIIADSNRTDQSLLNEMVILNIGISQCFIHDIAVQDGIQDRLTEFANNMTVTAVALTSFSSGSLPELEPIQDVDVEFPVFSYLRILPECDFSPCQPDLKVEVIQRRTSRTVLAGSNNEVVVYVRVTSLVDSSYNTKLSVAVDPPRLTFRREVLQCNTGECDPSLRCDPFEGRILCDIGNPLRTAQFIDLTLNMVESGLLGNESTVIVKVNASSINEENETNTRNNKAEVKITVEANASVGFTGAPFFIKTVSGDQIVKLVSGTANASDSLKDFTHEFSWKNNGPSLVPGWNIQLWWPTFGKGNKMPAIDVTYRSKGEEVAVNKNCSEPSNTEGWSTPNLPPSCSGIGCIPIECNVTQTVEKGAFLSFRVTSVVSLQYLLEYVSERQGELSNPELTITSYATAKVSSVYTINSTPVSGEVTTDVTFLIEFLECVPVWILIVSVMGALVLLAVAVVILYVLGFFKQRHQKMLIKSSSVPKAAGAGVVEGYDENDEEQHVNRYSTSSNKRQSKSEDDGDGYENTKRQSKSEIGADGYENVNRQSMSSTVRNEEDFKMGAVQLQEEPQPARRSTASYGDGGGTAPDSFDLDEKGRQSQSSHSQTTV